MGLALLQLLPQVYELRDEFLGHVVVNVCNPPIALQCLGPRPLTDSFFFCAYKE